MATKVDRPRFIHTPSESAQNLVAYVEFLEQNPGLKFGLESIDRPGRALGLRPGEVEFVIARPGHGKTTWLVHRSRAAARRLKENGQRDKVCLFFTWEQSIEQIELSLIADENLPVSDVYWQRKTAADVRAREVHRPSLPIWLGGKSVATYDARSPRMTIDLIWAEIRDMKDEFGVEPAHISIDYLQIIPIEKARDRVKEVEEATIQVKELALDLNVPISVGVQAKLTSVGVPEMGDTYYTSVVDMVGDKVWGICKAEKEKVAREGTIPFVDGIYRVYPHLQLIKLIKQRGERAGFKWAIHWDMSNNVVTELAAGVRLDSGPGIGDVEDKPWVK